MKIIKEACTVHKGRGIMTMDMELAPLGHRFTCRTWWCWEFLFFYKFPLFNMKWIHCPSSGNRTAQRAKLCFTAISIAFYSSKLEDFLELTASDCPNDMTLVQWYCKEIFYILPLVENIDDLGQRFSSDILRILYSPFFVLQHFFLCDILGSFQMSPSLHR